MFYRSMGHAGNVPPRKSPSLNLSLGEKNLRGEIWKIRKRARVLSDVPNDLDFLILYYPYPQLKGKRMTGPMARSENLYPLISTLQKALGDAWVVRRFRVPQNDEVLSDFAHFYWASKGWDTGKKWDEYSHFSPELMEFLGQEVIDKEDKAGTWHLLGDESLIDRRRVLRYIWVVVPPGAGLPPAPQGAHAMEGNSEQTKQMARRLIAKANPSRPLSERIQIHIFDGPSEQGSGKEDYTHRTLPDTLPVVMDAIRSRISNKTATDVPLRILAEGFGPGIAKAGKTLSLIPYYTERAIIGSVPSFLEKLPTPKTYLPKDGHPLLAYADAALMALNQDFPVTFSKDLERLTQRWTFDEAKILSDGLLNSTTLSEPNKFYHELRELPTADHPNLSRRNDTLESIVKLYSSTLAKDLSITNFLRYEEESDSAPNYQWASERMIEDRGGIDAWISEIKPTSYKRRFDAHFSGFTYANRRSDSEAMERQLEAIDRLRNEHGQQLDQSRIRDFARVLEADLHTVFVFSKEDKAVAIIDESESRLEKVASDAFDDNASPENRHYLGSRLLREAFRDGPAVSPRILELQRMLRDADIEDPAERSRHRRRHTSYLIEMLVDISRATPESLEEAVDVYEESLREDEQPDIWRLTALMKLGVVLYESGIEVPESITNQITNLPREIGSTGNPNMRCMAWGARLCDSIGKANQRKRLVNTIREKAERAIEGEEEPYKDAMGLTHACHVIDLERHDWGRGKKGVRIGEDYLKIVLENSASSTQEWYSENSPTDDDPLRPLNFIYR